MTRESGKSKIRMSVIVDGKHINSLKKADEVIDQIFDEFREQLQYKDDEIELLKCRIEEAMKPKTCDGCKHKPNDGECYYEPCGTCARFFYDHYEPKATT